MNAASPEVMSLAGAFLAGIGGSLHCALMCGPLACAAGAGRGQAPRASTVATYQATRIAAYGLVGGLFGALGAGVGSTLAVSTRPYLPWLMAAALFASAFELGKKLRPLPGVRQLSERVFRASAVFAPPVRAGAIAALTPLLPCGLLYGFFAAAAASGSFWSGAALMSAFALGALPALLAAQCGTGFWRRSGPVTFVLTKLVPATAGLVLIYRAITVAKGGAHRCH